ncbi:hypothetical protein ABZY93_32520 [Streptomyces smyrnaeus]|uniref:hypothetical protein n=1 Tax=Streptomyces smyrnaeus TaxID=1387713 RepID=UPI00339FBDC1
MGKLRDVGGGRCATCGWPLHDPYQIVSRHPVAAGTVVYARCACGTLRVWLQQHRGGDRLVVGARSTAQDAVAPPEEPDGHVG